MPLIPPDVSADFDLFARGPELLTLAFDGLGKRAFDRPSSGDAWSARDVIVHMADTELVRAVRIRFLLVEDQPAIANFDEARWRDVLHYSDRDPRAALALFRAIRDANVELLRQLNDAGWSRAGRHSEDGLLTVADLMRRGATHVLEHIAQLMAIS